MALMKYTQFCSKFFSHTRSILTFRVRLIATWKRKIIIVNFYEKLESKLRHMVKPILWLFPWRNFLWCLRKEKISTKNNKRWKLSTHKNEHEMKNIITYLNLYSNFSQKSTIIIFLFHVTIKRTLKNQWPNPMIAE